MPPGVRRTLHLPASSEKLERDLDDEVEFHLAMRAAELEKNGMSPTDARAEALRKFGDTDDLRQYCKSIEVPHMRRMHLKEWWESWMQDVRYGLRQLVRAPGFFAIAVLTLGLGIAATTAIFSVVRGVLLRPLPYAEPERLVQLWQLNDGAQNNFSSPNFQDIREQSSSFSGLAEMSGIGSVSVSGIPEPVRTRSVAVSRDFFDILGVKPIMGRTFLPEEQQVGAAPAVVISHGFWQRVLGGSPSAIGQKLIYDDQAFTVVGVMPRTLEFPADVELWVPRELRPVLPYRTGHNWKVIGRLKDGVSVEQARADVSVIARRLKQQHGDATWMTDATVIPLQEQIVGGAGKTLFILLGGSLLLLLIACANVVNLLIARMAARQSEIAVRVALGAGRGRLIQQCLAEALMLSLAAGALGVALANVGVRLLLKMQPGNLPRLSEVRVDAMVLTFAIGIAVVAAIVMGILTAWRATRGEIRDLLSQSTRTQGGTMSSERIRRGLVIAQVAMAVVLLVATGLFARSMMRLLSVDPGFRPENKVVVDITAGGANTDRVRIYDEMLSRFRMIPGVTAAGGVNAIPLTGGAANGTFIIMNSPTEQISMDQIGQIMQNKERTGSAEFRIASPGYFEAMGIGLKSGRLFEERDAITAPHVAVISASLAKTRWPNEDAIGKVIQFGNMDGDMRPFTIVGVVGDVRDVSLDVEPRPTLYASYRQRPVSAWRFNFVLATPGDPTAIVNTAQRIVRSVSPDIPPRVRTIETIVTGSVADRRFVLSLVGVFGIAALVLAALGIYSVISYLVTQRAREISIRVALGARSGDVVKMVLKEGVGLAAFGILAGASIAFLATRVIEKMLYGVSATDPTAFALVVLLLAAVALIASWVPARRASRMEAMEVLRAA
jgi:predicted permease